MCVCQGSNNELISSPSADLPLQTAIIRSSFREVLYLDSDNMPAASLATLSDTVLKDENGRRIQAVTKANVSAEAWGDPIGLWESKAYKRLGVMFWPDYWRTVSGSSRRWIRLDVIDVFDAQSADNPIWAIIGVPC